MVDDIVRRYGKAPDAILVHCKNHGFMPVRGRIKCGAVALLPARLNNSLAAHRLRAESL